jgi:diaminopropionate ammonia-lyase family
MAETTAPVRQEALRIVGRSPTHHDFEDKVAGSLLYAADWQLPGMLCGKVVRAQVPCARIAAVDVEAARAVPGVVAVLTAADVPWNQVVERASGGLGELAVAMPVLAGERVRYLGEPVALVAAVDAQAAEEAAELVEVDYQDLPGVFDAERALEPDAPLVHDEGNLLVSWTIGRGDPEAALQAADLVVEGTYRTQRVEHAYLEPEAGVGWVDTAGVVTLRVATQVIEHAATIAAILGLPTSKVRVIGSYMGGGFGGKEDMTVEPYLALLVWHTRRPVRMVWDRQDSIMASTKRHPFTMRYRTGVRRDGTIVGQTVDIVGDAGAYPYLSARVLFAACALASGPYRVPQVHHRARAVFTNNVPTSAFRGFGAMQVTFGYEQQLDRVAAALGLDPLAVRERNFLAKGDLLPTGERLDTAVAAGECLRRAVEALGEPPRPSGPGRLVGRGVAANMQPYGRTMWFHDQASCWIGLEADGSLLLRSGVTDLGGGQAASLAQIASEVLGVPLKEIAVHIGDSQLTPPAGGTFATRQLYMSGNAALAAARELRAALLPVAAELLGADPDRLVFEDGMVRERGDPGGDGKGVRLAELTAACQLRGVPCSRLVTWHAETGTFDPAAGQGASFPDYTFGAHAADVEVDTGTGQVRVLAYVAAHDVGRAINPLRVAGQIQGGAYQGLGYALGEEVATRDGQPVSTLLADYLLPGPADLPDVRAVVVESGEGKGPFGARGIGEPPIGNPAATIANAVAAATGVRVARLPITPERLLEALDAAGELLCNPAARPEADTQPPPRAPLALHRRLPGYQVTPLLAAQALARAAGVAQVWVKDESSRLGLPAFKMLGASWAAYRAVAARLGRDPEPWADLDELRRTLEPLRPLTLVAATDGNHGRAVARMAALLGAAAEVYVPAGTAAARIAAIEGEGATVTVVDGDYDAAVAAAAASADERRLVVQDVAARAGEQVPAWVVEGYATIFWEADEQLGGGGPDVVVVPVGVGALAAAAVRHYRRRGLRQRPRLIGVEPLGAACVLRSLAAGRVVTVPGPHRSIMAGLNCGTPSLVAWPLLRSGLDAVVAVADGRARQAMRDLAAVGVVAGESGAASLAGLAELTTGPQAARARRALGLGADARVLLLCTEGATDPDAYRRIVAGD